MTIHNLCFLRVLLGLELINFPLQQRNGIWVSLNVIDIRWSVSFRTLLNANTFSLIMLIRNYMSSCPATKMRLTLILHLIINFLFEYNRPYSLLLNNLSLDLLELIKQFYLAACLMYASKISLFNTETNPIILKNLIKRLLLMSSLISLFLTLALLIRLIAQKLLAFWVYFRGLSRRFLSLDFFFQLFKSGVSYLFTVLSSDNIVGVSRAWSRWRSVPNFILAVRFIPGLLLLQIFLHPLWLTQK